MDKRLSFIGDNVFGIGADTLSQFQGAGQQPQCFQAHFIDARQPSTESKLARVHIAPWKELRTVTWFLSVFFFFYIGSNAFVSVFSYDYIAQCQTAWQMWRTHLPREQLTGVEMCLMRFERGREWNPYRSPPLCSLSSWRPFPPNLKKVLIIKGNVPPHVTLVCYINMSLPKCWFLKGALWRTLPRPKQYLTPNESIF